MAPRSCPSEVDDPACTSGRTTEAKTRYRIPDCPHRTRESVDGIRQDPRGIVETGFRAPSNDHQKRSALASSAACSAAGTQFMAYISKALSTADARVRFLHGRNRSLGNALRPLLHRTRFPARPPRRL